MTADRYGAPSAPPEASAPPRRVDANEKPKRRGGNRGRGRRATVRQIQGKARERQAEWAKTAQSARVELLTTELDDLYEELRDERKGHEGAPFKGRSASYVSPPTKAPKPWREAA